MKRLRDLFVISAFVFSISTNIVLARQCRWAYDQLHESHRSHERTLDDYIQFQADTKEYIRLVREKENLEKRAVELNRQMGKTHEAAPADER